MDIRKIAGILTKTAALLVVIWGILILFVLNSAPYKFALAYIRANETVMDRLGSIKTARTALWGSDSASYGGSSGFAEFNINVVGEKGKGVAHLKLLKKDGQWFVKDGELILPEGAIVQLPSSSSKTGQPAQ